MNGGRGGCAGSASVPLGELAVVDDRPAVIEPGRGRISYAALDRLADAVAARLLDVGLATGDRVGIDLHRSIDAVAAILGILRAGGTWVPVDPRAPAERNAAILADCGVRATFVDTPRGDDDGAPPATANSRAETLVLGPVGAGEALAAWAAEPARRVRGAPSDVACVLSTSGSTGRPKGWRMTRAAIEAHARWCHDLLRPGPADTFANHAQFSFGMSLFDIFSSLGCGATLVLVPEAARALAPRVVDVLEAERVTILFAGPTILELIAGVEGLESRDLTALRVIAFAGQVFPPPPLMALRRRLPHPRYFNFYGSTETNVAAWHEIPAGAELDGPAPIGRPCPHFEARVVALPDQRPLPDGTGELQLRGIGLSAGYMDRPELNAERLAAADDGGEPWHRTGDLARVLENGDLEYAGRLGRMVKLHGHRVEPGEIEARLHEHPGVREAAVIPVEGPRGLQLVAHLAGPRLPVVELMEFCAGALPAYMIPERFEFHAALPRNLRGKIDYTALAGG